MNSIPDEMLDLFEKATFAHFATMTPMGYPHVTPVWVDYDADTGHLLVNTERERRKTKNVEANPNVGVSMVDPTGSSRPSAMWTRSRPTAHATTSTRWPNGTWVKTSIPTRSRANESSSASHPSASSVVPDRLLPTTLPRFPRFGDKNERTFGVYPHCSK